MVAGVIELVLIGVLPCWCLRRSSLQKAKQCRAQSSRGAPGDRDEWQGLPGQQHITRNVCTGEENKCYPRGAQERGGMCSP